MLLIAALLATGEVHAQTAQPPVIDAPTPPPPVELAPAVPAPALAPMLVIAPPSPAPVAELAAAQDGTAEPTAGPKRQHHYRHAKGDPLEGLNRKLFAFHQRVDHAFFRPLAMLYKHVIPKPLRTAMRHLLSNLNEPLVFMNDVLQLKPKRAARTFSRFVINTTVGIGGIIDVAKTADLPHHDNSLGDTLARYGVGPGPYLFVPFLGPTDLRDLLSGQAENVIYPLAIGDPFDDTVYQAPSGLVAGLDLRAESDADFKALLDGAADPYATLRSVFQQSRSAEIAEIKGKRPAPELDDPLTDPEAMATTPSADAAETASPQPPVPDTATPPAETPPADATPTPTTPVGPTPAPASPPPAAKTAPGDSKTPDPDPATPPVALSLHTL